MPPELARTLLLVDDEAVHRDRLARALRVRGLLVAEAEDVAGALRLAEADTPEWALVDLRLPDGNGLEVVRRLKALDPATVIVVLTGYGSIATALDAVRLGAAHYLTKPAEPEEILAGFARAGRPPDVPAQPAQWEPPSLARVEWEHLNRVLVDSGGNVSEAARRLGLHRRSLQRKLAKYPARR